MSSAPIFPSTEALEPGCYVENVHPCGRYDDYGLVLRAEGGADEPGEQGELTVQYAIGGSVFGPSRNWRRTDRRPAWLARLEPARCYCPGDCNCRHQGAPYYRPNLCGCKRHAEAI